jgi:ABC-type Fe3+-citrate transport system substrate-binding protein
MFFRHKKQENFSIMEEENMGSEVSCILIGVKQLFIDRLIDLGAIPMAMVDDKEAKNIAAKTRKRANPHVGSLGHLEVSLVVLIMI